jgi:tRNA uridine 5-carbamoylmethylation protein Kti12
MKNLEIQILIIMAGLPGSGKSTLAKELSKLLKFALIDLDHLKDTSVNDPHKQGWLAYDIFFKLIECQLSNGINLIVDTCLTYDWIQEKIFSYAKCYKSLPIILLCQCSDDTARQRVQKRLEKGERLACTVEKYERLQRVFHLNDGLPDLILDTSLPVLVNANKVIVFLESLLFYLEEADDKYFLIDKIIDEKLSNISQCNIETLFDSSKYEVANFEINDIFSQGIKIELSNGEIIDKFTILLIKLSNIKNPTKLLNIRKEYFLLLEPVNYIKHKLSAENLKLINELLDINTRLWDIEDRIRQKEVDQEFDQEFIDLARSVYSFNNKRSNIKLQINLASDSCLIEEKEYVDN